MGWEETGNWEWKALLYNLQRVSRVTQQHYNPLHPWWFRIYKQKPEEKMDDQPVPSIVLYGRRQARCRERINQSPLSQSLIRKQQVGSQQQEKDTSPPPLWVILWSPAHYYRYTHTDSTHTMNTWIQTQHTNTLTQINNIHAETEPLSLHIDDCLLAWKWWTDGARLSNARHNYINGVNSQHQPWHVYLLEKHFLWVTQFFHLWANPVTCYIDTKKTALTL